jgi:hypothetical protein
MIREHLFVGVRVTLWLAVYCRSVRLDDWSPLRLTTSIFFQLNTCFHSPYVTLSLTRGWVSRLQLLLVLESAVILRSESRGTHDHILLSRIRDSPNLEGQVLVFISHRDSVAQLYPRYWVPFSSPPTTRRATVEVFDPASTRASSFNTEKLCPQSVHIYCSRTSLRI